MPGNMAGQALRSPLVLADTENLSHEEWLAYRRRGIGGSDVAAILGISPFRTARDIYYDKLDIADVEPDEGNWVAMEMGHLLEDLVAKIFRKKTGYGIYQIKKYSSTRNIPLCWRMWTILYPCRTAPRLFWRSRPRTITRKTTGG